MMVNATSEQSKHKSRTFNALIYISLNFGAKIPGFNDEIEVLNKQEMVLNFLSFLTWSPFSSTLLTVITKCATCHFLTIGHTWQSNRRKTVHAFKIRICVIFQHFHRKNANPRKNLNFTAKNTIYQKHKKLEKLNFPHFFDIRY